MKIARVGDLDSIPNNSPHPGCRFVVEWYGFDEGPDVVSTVTFTMHAPTRDVGLTVQGPTTVPVGGDPASGAGTPTGLDGREAYTLAFAGEPHPKQGYHVRLTVATPRSQGNDTKTKVFWVEPCARAVSDGGAGTGTGTGAGAGQSGGQPDQVVAGAGGEVTTGADQRAGVGAPTADAPPAVPVDLPTAVEAGTDGGGPGTVMIDVVRSPAGMLVLAAGLLTLGAAAALRRRGQA